MAATHRWGEFLLAYSLRNAGTKATLDVEQSVCLGLQERQGMETTDMPIAKTPEPPYYAAIFTTVQSDDSEGYLDMAKRMFALAAEQPSYLGFEITGSGSLGIGISYWTDEASIRAWKANAEHQVAQDLGRDRWYDRYQLRIAKVERDYGFAR